ncbi:MAG: hypothetical protein QW261_06540 [Candidatus Jordarchaeaceae archaeon]
MLLEKRLKVWIEEFDAYAGLKPPLFTDRLSRDPSLDGAMGIVGREAAVNWPLLKKKLEEMRTTYKKSLGYRLILLLMLLVIASGFIFTFLTLTSIHQTGMEFPLFSAVPILLLVVLIVFGDWIVYIRNTRLNVKRFASTALESRKMAQALINKLVNRTEKNIRLKLYYSKYQNTLIISKRLTFNPIMTRKYLVELRRT